MNKKLLFMLILLIGSFIFINAVEEELKTVDFNSIGIIGNISASGVEVGVQNYETNEGPQKDAIISVKDERAVVQIGAMEFRNMQPNNSTLKVDRNGDLLEADFITSKETVYNFGGEDIVVPENSRVIFDKQNGLIIEASDGAEFQESFGLKDLKIKGKNVKLPEGIMKSGELKYNENGKISSITSGTDVSINKIQISAKKDLDIFYDGGPHEGNYMSFGDEFYFGGEGNPGEIIFEKGNDYFPKMKDGTSVKFGLGEEYSSVNIVKNSLKGFPDVYCENQYNIETGKLSFSSDGVRLVRRDFSGEKDSVEMDVYTSVGKYNKIISIGSDSNYYSYVSDKEINKRILAYNRKELGENMEVKSNSYDPTYVETKLATLSNYLQKGQDALKTEYIKKCGNNPSVDCYLTPDERTKIVTLAGYPDYEKYFDYYSILEGVAVPTFGTLESMGSIKNLNVGEREINKVYIKGVTKSELINTTALNFTYNPDAY